MTSSLAVIQKVQRLKRLRAKSQAARAAASATKPELSHFWRPNPGPQTVAWNSDCHELLYGGEAGGGKSALLTALPLKWSHRDGFLALTLRREYKQGKQLRKYSRKLYRKVYPGLEPIKSEGYAWNFPSGAEAVYGHCEHEDDYDIYDGWEINLLAIDELTHFTRTQYLALCARVRSSDPNLPTYIRATTNPGGEGHEWVFERWGAWLNPEFDGKGLEPRFDDQGNRLPPAHPCEVLWVRTHEDGTEEYSREARPGALSRTFVPARLDDNPYIDDTYRDTLNQLDPVRRAQLRDGNWLIRPAAGLYFKREWVEIVDEAPAGVRWLRNWDLAATEATAESPNPDWTAGVKIGVLGSTIYIGDVVRRRATPGAVRNLIRNTAELDGPACSVGIPQDPGQAGKSQAGDFVSLLSGFTVLVETESGDKVTRFGPFSSQAEHGNVKLVRGAWNEAYIQELEAFPSKGVHDDQVDATSGGYRRLTSGAANFLDAMQAYEARQ